MPAGRIQWDGKSEEEILAKLQEVWAMGGTNAEASYYANVSESSITRFLQKKPEVAEIRKRLLEKPILKARQEVVKGLAGNPEFSLKYLERKRKHEFSTRVENDLTSNDKELSALTDERKQEVDELIDSNNL